MTTLFHETEICAVCGRSHTIHGLSSTNTMGPCDLDSRPAEMKRSTMDYWVQECPDCGYCASSTSEAADGTEGIVRGDAYQSLRQDFAKNPTARKFLMQSLIAVELGRTVDGCWANIHAAWGFDDAKEREQARRCRIAAVDLARMAAESSESIAGQTGVSELIRADLLRRVAKSDEARAMAQAGLATECEDDIKKILSYEIALIDSGDIACRDISGAFKR